MRKVTDSPEAQVLNLRSASCNDIASVKNGTDTPKGFDKNCNNQMMTSTSSISSMSPSIGYKPGMILARSSELLSRGIQSNGDCKSPFRSWKSLCTMPFINIPSVSIETHPFSGLITSQIQCNGCFWKVLTQKWKITLIVLVINFSENNFHAILTSNFNYGIKHLSI